MKQAQGFPRTALRHFSVEFIAGRTVEPTARSAFFSLFLFGKT